MIFGKIKCEDCKAIMDEYCKEVCAILYTLVRDNTECDCDGWYDDEDSLCHGCKIQLDEYLRKEEKLEDSYNQKIKWHANKYHDKNYLDKKYSLMEKIMVNDIRKNHEQMSKQYINKMAKI